MGRKSALIKLPKPADIGEDLKPWEGDEVYKGKRTDIMRSQDHLIVATMLSRNIPFSQISYWYEHELNRSMNNVTIRTIKRELAKVYREESSRSYEEMAGQQIAQLRMDQSEARANYEAARDEYFDEVQKLKRRTVVRESAVGEGKPKEVEEETYELASDRAMTYWWGEIQKITTNINEIMGLQRRKSGSINFIGQQNIAEQTNNSVQKAYVSLDPDKWDEMKPNDQAHGTALLMEPDVMDIIEGEFE